MSQKLKVLELYSGIGGMHYAIEESEIPASVIAAVDINEVANSVYRHNFSTSTSHQRNISSLLPDELNRINPDVIMMSPPCQPFTRVGLKRDMKDGRTDSFLHILEILPALHSVQYILIENVKGFEVSETRNKLLTCLISANYIYQEFMLSPHQFLIPNTRHRYYLIAKRVPKTFCFTAVHDLMTSLPIDIDSENTGGSFCYKCKNLVSKLQKNLVQNKIKSLEGSEDKQIAIKDILEHDIEGSYLLSSKILSRHSKLLDIVTPTSVKSCCFTKAYSHYVEGTGSIFCPYSEADIENAYRKCKDFEAGSEVYINILKDLKLRYFTPKEIARLMCFPESFSFPDSISMKQKYRLLGNSVNVHVVALLFALLVCNN